MARSLSARVSPACRYVGLIMCSHTRSIHFLFIFGFPPVVYTKKETRKKRERNETLVEEIIPPPKRKLISKKRAKKVATPHKSSLGSPKIPRSSGKSPSPQKKGRGARAEPIQLEGHEFGPPEEEPPVPSLIALENAHLHAFNQLSLVNMRHVNQEEEPNNQQVAVEQRTHVNEVNAQLVCTHGRIPPAKMGGRTR